MKAILFCLSSKIILLSILLIGNADVASAQYNNNLVKPVIPPSPDAAALGKYGSIPVGLHTGIPNIEIPLYTIKTSQLEVPISISYHASGIKVNEIASWIGIGWVLNCGGVISRSVVGNPDENSGFWSLPVKSAQQVDFYEDFGYLKTHADGLLDGESDFYFYNFLGRSGKFVYEQNSGNQTPILIPETPIKINWTSIGVEVIDENGIQYKFGAVESMTVSGTSDTFGSSYFLSEIVSADGTDHIYFSYLGDNSYGEGNIRNYTETIGQTCNSSGVQNGYHVPNYVAPLRQISSMRLKEITFSNGKVEFIPDNSRLDVPPIRLEEVRVSSKNTDGTYTHLKSFFFQEDYFVSTSVSGFGTEKDMYRLKLAGLIEQDSELNLTKRYNFFYNETNILPDRTSLAQDWWGFYNGRHSNTSLIATKTISFFDYDYYVGGAIREPNSTFMQACMLNKIVYPTGGYTEFDYEPHYYGNGTMAGGLRAKEIRDYDGSGSIPVTKIYKYGTGETGNGELLIPSPAGLSNSEQEIDFIYSSSGSGVCLQECSGKKMIISGQPVYDLSTLNGAPVVYPEVAVYEGSTSAAKGKQVFKFDVVIDQTTYADKAYNNGLYQLNNSWEGGSELWNGVYKGNSPTPITETFNTYEVLKWSTVIGTKVGWKVSFEGCGFPNSAGNGNGNNGYFYAFDYPIYSGVKKLTSTTSKRYSSDPLGLVETKIVYNYDDLGPLHQQLSSKITIDSDGSAINSQYWYPSDYASVENIFSLLSKNIIAIPIKEENYKNGKIMTGKVNRLDQNGKPYEIHMYETNVPQSPPNHDENVIVPPGYLKKASIFYDDITQKVSKVQLTNNFNTIYLWGYNNALPVAEVKNAEKNQSDDIENITLSIGTVQVTGLQFENYTLEEDIDISFVQNVTLNCTVSREGADVSIPDHYFNVNLSLYNQDTQTEKYLGAFGITTQSSHTINNLPVGKYTLRYQYHGDIGSDNPFTFDPSLDYQIKNVYSNIFYTSFEEDTQNVSTEAHTGRQSHSGSYTLYLPKQTGEYILSYWRKEGTGEWEYKEDIINITSTIAQSKTIETSGILVDEIRLHPRNAKMTTYTHDPLIGMTSVTDPNNITTYYEYDALGRLETIKDSDQNIVKHFKCHYQNEQ